MYDQTGDAGHHWLDVGFWGVAAALACPSAAAGVAAAVEVLVVAVKPNCQGLEFRVLQASDSLVLTVPLPRALVVRQRMLCTWP